MQRREFFRFMPAAAALIPLAAVAAPKSRKVPLYLVPEKPEAGSMMRFEQIQGCNVMVDLDAPLESQFAGRYLERVRAALKKEA